jgi:hypothetical protein
MLATKIVFTDIVQFAGLYISITIFAYPSVGRLQY